MLDIRAVVLLPPKDLSGKITALSQQLNKSGESPIELSDRHLPHVTIVQTDAPAEALRDIGQQVLKHWSAEDVLTLAGLCLVPEESRVWLEIPALKSDRLAVLQDNIVELIKQAGYQALSGVKDSYRPHVTLGLIPPAVTPIPVLDHKILRASTRDWKIAVAELEDNYVVTKDNIMNVNPAAQANRMTT